MENRPVRFLLVAMCAAVLSQSAFALGDFGGSSLDPSDFGIGSAGPILPPRLYVNTPGEYQRIMGLKAHGDAFYRNIQVMRGFNPHTGAALSQIFPMRLNSATGQYEPNFHSSLALGGGTFIFDNAGQQDAITQYFALVQGAGVLSRGIGMATGSGAYAPIDALRVSIPRIMTTSAPVPMTNLYRAVMPTELADITATGAFRNVFGIESKYFSTSAQGAGFYARQAGIAFGDGPFTIVQTRVPTSLLQPSMLLPVDRGIHSVVLPTRLLPELTQPTIMQLTPHIPSPAMLPWP